MLDPDFASLDPCSEPQWRFRITFGAHNALPNGAQSGPKSVPGGSVIFATLSSENLTFTVPGTPESD